MTWRDLIKTQIFFTDDETDFTKEILEEVPKLKTLQEMEKEKEEERIRENDPDRIIIYGMEVYMIREDGEFDADGIITSFKGFEESVHFCAKDQNWKECDALSIRVPYNSDGSEYDELLFVKKSKV